MENTTRKLALFKLEEDTPVAVGFLNSELEVEEYFKQIQQRIDLTMQTELEGEYFVVPAMYINVSRNVSKEKTKGFKEDKKQTKK